MNTATKLDFFDFIVFSLFGFLAFIVALEVGTWIADQVREYLRRRRLHRAGIEEELLPRPNAGFQLKDGSSAVRRHFDHGDELGLLTQQGWGQMRNRSPAPDAGSRHLREPD